MYDKTTTNIILNGEKLKALFLDQQKDKYIQSSLLFKILLKVITTAIRQEKKISGIQIGKEKVKWSLFTDDIMLHIEYPKDTRKNYKS